jgi:hypothetical protein
MMEELSWRIIQKMQELQKDVPSDSCFVPDAEYLQLFGQLVEQFGKDNLFGYTTPELITVLQTATWEVKLKAIERLGENPSPEARLALLATLNDNSEIVRRFAINALCSYKDEEVAQAIIKCFVSENLDNAASAAICLKEFGALAVPHLTALLQHDEPKVRAWSAILLGDIRDPSALPDLEKLAETDTEIDYRFGTVKNVAARAIRSISRWTKGQVELVGKPQSYDRDGWYDLLKNWSVALLGSNDLQEEPSEEAIVQEWLGLPGASESEIAALEKRLNTKLPPSYRDFLSISNGWGQLNHFIYDLFPAQSVDWFSILDPDWVKAWTEPVGEEYEPLEVPDEVYFDYSDAQDAGSMRNEYLKSCLQISSRGDSAILLLNPVIQTPEGEWEAWFFANWLPGARRYRSFWELMNGELRSFVNMERE